VLLALAIVVAGGSRLVRSRRHSAKSGEITRLLESSRSAELAGRFGEALYEMEGALSIARALTPPPADLAALARHRDELSLLDAKWQLGALASGPAGDRCEPARAVGIALTLLARSSKDPALSGLVPAIETELDRHRVRWAEADYDAASHALAAGDPARAIEHCKHMYSTADSLAAPSRRRLVEEATALAGRIIDGHGVVILPPKGHFTLGSPKVYSELINPAIITALRGAGYLSKTADTVWDDIWNTRAPYRVTLEVTERQDAEYLSSPSRLSRIDAKLTLWRKQLPIWSESPNASTQVPLPGLPAYLASRVAATDKRSPECERLLYEDARANLIGRLAYNLRHVPECRPSGIDPQPAS
jgi:hypothetical protein